MTQRFVTLAWLTNLHGIPTIPIEHIGQHLLLGLRSPMTDGGAGQVVALTLTKGEKAWQLPLGSSYASGCTLVSHPLTGEQLALVSTTTTELVGGRGILFALTERGIPQWRWEMDDIQRLSDGIWVRGADQYFLTGDTYYLFGIDVIQGETRTHIKFSHKLSSMAPAYAADLLLLPTLSEHLLSFSPQEKKIVWSFDIPLVEGWLNQTPAVDAERAYAPTSEGIVYAIDLADGEPVWRTPIVGQKKQPGSPAVGEEYLYVGGHNGLYAFDKLSGRQAWHFPTSRKVVAAPQLIGDTLFFTCHDHFVYALDCYTGEIRWKYGEGVRRRIEIGTTLVAAERKGWCFFVDQNGDVRGLERPLEALESALTPAQLRAAALDLEVAEEYAAAAERYQQLGETERAAALFEKGDLWEQAAELWGELGFVFKQAQALEAHARELEQTHATPEERAEAWEAAAGLFEQLGEKEEVIVCRRYIARHRKLPIIILDVKHGGLVLDEWSPLELTLRNAGFGLARTIVVKAEGMQFEGQLAHTYHLFALRPDQSRTETVDICPKGVGRSVPLTLKLEYTDQHGNPTLQRQTLHVSVSRTSQAAAPQASDDIFRKRTGSAIYSLVQSDIHLAELHRYLTIYFSREDLKQICFNHLQVDYEDFSEKKSTMAQELIEYCQRNGRLDFFIAVCEEMRPHVDWQGLRSVGSNP